MRMTDSDVNIYKTVNTQVLFKVYFMVTV